jgi:hypothetical protein
MAHNKKHNPDSLLIFKALLVSLLLLVNCGVALANGAGEASGGAVSPGAAGGGAIGGTAGGEGTGVLGTGSTKAETQKFSTFNVKTFLSVDGSGGAGVTKGTQEQKYLKSDNPTAAFIVQVINMVTLTAASLSFLAVVIAGFLIMSSTGNENQRTKGLEILQKAVIGLVITLSAYFIVAFVQNLLFESVAK